MADEGGDVDEAAGQERHKGFKIAGFRPAHIANGVVVAGVFVGRIVAAGPVGPRHHELEFLCVVQAPRQVHPDSADDGHMRPVPGQLPGQFDRIIVGRVGADQHGVKAGASCESQTGRFSFRPDDGLKSLFPPQRHSLGRQVDPKGARPGCLDDGQGQLAQEPHSDHSHLLAHLNPAQSEAVQCDGAKGRKRAGFEVDVVRQMRQQVPWHLRILGMDGMAASGANHAVTRVKLGQPGSDGHHRSRRAVAQRHGLSQPGAHGLKGSQRTLLPCLVDQLTDEVRP